MKLNFFSKFAKARPGRHSGGRQYLFLALAFVMLVVVSGLVIYSLTFLIANFDKSLSEERTMPSPLKFDIKGFEELKLIR